MQATTAEAAEPVPEAAPEGEVITAYKGFDANWECREFQFKVGKSYIHEGDVEACKSGFHSCLNPLDVWNYYGPCDNRFAIVKASGAISRHDSDSKIASASLTIEAELKLPKFIAAAVEWLLAACKSNKKAAASGDSSQLAASGDSSQLAASGNSSKLAASGNSSKLAASGNYSQLAASGDSSQLAASGYSSQLAASGNYSQLAASGYSSQLAASGNSSIVIAAATDCKAKAGALGTIVLTRWVESEKRYRISVAYVGENGIKADAWYSLDGDGQFVEAK
jgi:hypothetical protein